MNNVHSARISDVRKLLLVFFAVAVMITVAFTVVGSESSEATPADGKTYYYNQYNDFEKSIYDAAVNATVTGTPGNYVAEFTVSVAEYGGKNYESCESEIRGQVNNVLSKIAHERMDMFWFGSSHYSSIPFYAGSKEIPTDGKITIRVESIYSAEEISTKKTQLATALTTIAPSIDTSNRYSTVESIHKYVCENLEYIAHDKDHPIPETMDIRNVATALIGDHIVVCEGYAKAFKYLCDQYNVPCIIVTGNGIDKDGNAEGHMWNYVQMENEKWYLVDCTWDDQSSIKYNYFLAGSESDGSYMKVSQDHVILSERYEGLTLPTLSVSGLDKCAVTLNYTDSEGSKSANVIVPAGDKLYASQLSKYAKGYTSGGREYRFNEWSGFTEGMTIGADISFTADYSRECKVTVSYKDGTGEHSTDVKKFEGDKLTASELDMYKGGYKTDNLVYTFSSWSGFTDGMTLTADLAVNAQYSSDFRLYTVAFRDSNGNTVAATNQDNYHFNDQIGGSGHVLPAGPVKDSDDYFEYVFREWINGTYKEGSPVDKDGIVLMATYDQHVRVISVPGGYKVNAKSDSMNFSDITSADMATIKSGSNDLSIVLPKATITFSAAAVAALAEDQTLAIKVISTAALDSKIRSSLNGATVYDIDFGTNNTVFSAGTATVAINWEVKAWQKASDLEVYYIDGATKTLVESQYDDENEQLVFTTDHFSTYAVYSNADDLTKIIDMLYENYIIVIIVLVTLFLFVLVYRFS